MSDANIKKLDHSAVTLTLTLPAAKIEEDYKKTLDKYVKNAQLPGFRKGHVPAAVLERKYGESLRTESTFDTMEAFMKAEIEKLDKKDQPLPYCTPELQDEEKLMPFKPNTDITFTVKYDVQPVFDLPAYTGNSVTIDNVSVSDDDVAKELDKLREQNAMVVDKKDGIAEKGNIVNLDYVELDDKNEPKADTERKDFTFTLGSGYNYYEFDDEIAGMKKDETKIIKKTYPADFKTSALAGKTITLKVTVKSVKVKDVPALDDDFAQDVKAEYKTVADLEKATREKLEGDLKARQSDEKFDKLFDLLLSKTAIDLPQSMMEAELERDWHNYIRQSGLSEDQVLKFLSYQGQDKKSITDSWHKDAEKALKTQLILSSIQEKEKFEVTKDEVDKVASEQLKEVTDANQKAYFRSLIEENLKVEKTSKFLEEKNTFVPGEKKTFDAYMNGTKAEEKAEEAKEK